MRRLPALAGVLAVVITLALLAVAELTWLPEAMPRESGARDNTLVVVPAAAASAVRAEAWHERVAKEATGDELMGDIIRTLNLRDERTGQPLTAAGLREHVVVDAQCVRAAGTGPERAPAARLSVIVRGLPQAEVEAVVRAWLASVLSRIDAVAVEAPGRYITSYSPCLES